jgi:hypothetical protein
MSDPILLDRVALGLKPKVTNFDGFTRRPLLEQERPLVVVHWPGVDVDYTQSDISKVAQAIERWKKGEYNYLIHPNGTIAEQAGIYRGAHARKFNPLSYGVNILVGLKGQVSDEQILSFRWLMGCLAWQKKISLTPMIAQHGWLIPTGCPGTVARRWDELTEGLRWA